MVAHHGAKPPAKLWVDTPLFKIAATGFPHSQVVLRVVQNDITEWSKLASDGGPN